MLAAAASHGHDGAPTPSQRGLHVAEVEVDVALHGDELRYRFGGVAQNLVGALKTLLDGDVRVGIHVADALVVDDEQGVDVLPHLGHALQRLDNLVFLLKEERDGHDANGEDALFLGDARHHGGCSCACSTAHSGRNKHHLRAIVEQVLNLFGVVDGRLLPPLGVAARPQGANGYLHGHGRFRQGLRVGVAYRKRYVGYAFLIHVAHGVLSTAAHTYHLDDVFRLVLYGGHKVDESVLQITYFQVFHLCCFVAKL